MSKYVSQRQWNSSIV